MQPPSFKKYILTTSDGTEIDSNGDYFILRLDQDPYAVSALKTYAESIKNINKKLYDDIYEQLKKYDGVSDPIVDTETIIRDVPEIKKVKDLFHIELEKDERGIILESSIKMLVSKILSISQNIYRETRRGYEDKIIFSGPMEKILYKRLEKYSRYFKGKFEHSDKSSDSNNIEIIRFGDYFTVKETEPETDLSGSKFTLIKKDEKQNDISYKINIK